MDEHNTKTLATEIIRTLKKIIFALIITNILTVGAFIWFISLPAEETDYTNTITQDATDIDSSDINQNVGSDLGGKRDANDKTK